jgi:hypothetical protein
MSDYCVLAHSTWTYRVEIQQTEMVETRYGEVHGKEWTPARTPGVTAPSGSEESWYAQMSTFNTFPKYIVSQNRSRLGGGAGPTLQRIECKRNISRKSRGWCPSTCSVRTSGSTSGSRSHGGVDGDSTVLFSIYVLSSGVIPMSRRSSLERNGFLVEHCNARSVSLVGGPQNNDSDDG